MRQRLFLIGALFVFMAILAILTIKEDNQPAAQGLEGDWTLVAATQNGTPLPLRDVKITLTIVGNTFTQKLNGDVIGKSQFKVDQTRIPNTIDDTGTEGPHEGLTSLSIYELKGDRLQICSALPGKSRPTAFLSRPGSGHSLESYLRARR